MATKSRQNESIQEGALNQILQALNEEGADPCNKIEISLLLLDESLKCLSGLGLIARLQVEVQAKTIAGKRYIRKYSLGTKRDWNSEGIMEDQPYLKQSELEEDE